MGKRFSVVGMLGKNSFVFFSSARFCAGSVLEVCSEVCSRCARVCLSARVLDFVLEVCSVVLEVW